MYDYWFIFTRLACLALFFAEVLPGILNFLNIPKKVITAVLFLVYESAIIFFLLLQTSTCYEIKIISLSAIISIFVHCNIVVQPVATNIINKHGENPKVWKPF